MALFRSAPAIQSCGFYAQKLSGFGICEEFHIHGPCGLAELSKSVARRVIDHRLPDVRRTAHAVLLVAIPTDIKTVVHHA